MWFTPPYPNPRVGGGGGGGGWGTYYQKVYGCAARSREPLPFSWHDSDPFPDKSKTNMYSIVDKKYMLICLVT